MDAVFWPGQKNHMLLFSGLALPWGAQTVDRAQGPSRGDVLYPITLLPFIDVTRGYTLRGGSTTRVRSFARLAVLGQPALTG